MNRINRCPLSCLLRAAFPLLVVGLAILLARATVRAQMGDPTVHIMATASADETAGSINVFVTLTNPPANQTVTVHYATANSSATAPADYTHTEGDLTWPAGTGDLVKTITVPIVNDGLADSGETFLINLSNCSGATIGTGTCTVTINDMGGPPPPLTVQFSADTYSKVESGGAATITVQLSAEPAQTVTVQYTTANGAPNGATAGSDYQSASGTLTFAAPQGGQPGETSKTFTVTIVQDCRVEGDETIQLQLSSPTNATLGTPSVATLTITDDDAAPPVTVTVTGGTFSPDPAPIETSVSTILSAQAMRPEPGAGCTLNAPTWTWSFVKAEYSDTSDSGPWTEALSGYSFQITSASAPPPDGTYDYSAVNLAASFSEGAYWRITLKAVASYTNCCTQAFVGAAEAVGKGKEFNVILYRWVPISNDGLELLKIASSTPNVLPGEGIGLEARTDPVGAASNVKFEWAVPPGKVFQDYSMTNTQGKLTPLDTAKLKAQEILFYWADTGDERELKCTVTGGNNVKRDWTAKLNVKKPSIAYSGSQGEVRWNAAKTRFGLYSTQGMTHGMEFSATVQVPAGFYAGEWEYVQTMIANMSSTLKNGTIENWNQNGEIVLDTAVPYPFNGNEDKPAPAGPYPTGATPGKAADSPDVLADATWTKRSISMDFKTYIMFKPAGYKSRWVPLQYIDWWWTGVAELIDGNWALTTAGQGPAGPLGIKAWDTTDHPVWEKNVKYGEWK